MSSCSEMEVISCCDPVQNPAGEPVSSDCADIDVVPVNEETASHDSSAKSPGKEGSTTSESSVVEDESAQLTTCGHEETAQNASNVHHREEAVEVNSDDAGNVRSCRVGDYKHQIAVKRRTAIVTRLDGVSLSTGSEASFYKCHLCGKLFRRLTDVPTHLSTHSPQQLTVYQCLLCDGSFSFKTKLVQHLRVRHNVVDLPRRLGNSEADGFLLSPKGVVDPRSSVAGSSDCDTENASKKSDEFLQSRTGLEIGDSKSDVFSDSQFKMLHLSVEASDGVPSDPFVLERLGLDRLPDGRKSFFDCNPVKGLTKTNSFLCQICGFESWRQNRLLQHIVKHHLDSVVVQKMRKQLLHRRKFHLPHRTPESNLTRTLFGNSGEPKRVLSETSNCLTLNASESRVMTSTVANTECREELLSLSALLKTADYFDERKCVNDDVQAIRSEQPYQTNDMQQSPETNYSEMSESCQITDELENENPITTSAPAVCAEQSKAMNNETGSSLVSMVSSTLHSMTPLDADAGAIPMSMSSLIKTHDNGPECKPLVFAPNNVSPLIHGFLPLPLLSLFVGQSALNPASFLGTSNSTNPSQFSSDQVMISQHASNAWNQSEKLETSKEEEEDIKPNRAVLDWRVMVRTRTRGLASRGSSILNAKFNAGNDQGDQNHEILKPVITSDGQAVYRCAYCSKDFSTASDITRHMEFHEDIRPYRCTHCDYHARTNSQLKVHMMRHQGIRKFQCRLCNYKGVTQSDLNRHAKSQIHMLKARNQCESCGEGFVSPINLGKHFHERHFDEKAEANPDLDHRQ